MSYANVQRSTSKVNTGTNRCYNTTPDGPSCKTKNTVTIIAVYYLLAETILYIAPLNVRIYI